MWKLAGILCLLSLSSGLAQNDGESVYLLESFPSYSLLLPLSQERNDTFLVKAPRFHRVMAVIQFLSLQPRNDFTCGVYLQFQDGPEKKSGKICGNFDPDEKSYSPTSLIGGPRSYASSKQALLATLVFPPGTKRSQEKAYVRIAFTAFRDDCHYNLDVRNRANSTTTELITAQKLQRYRPCSYATSPDGIGRNCIVSNLFCDSILNCGAGEEDFGLDETEQNCPSNGNGREGREGWKGGQVDLEFVSNSNSNPRSFEEKGEAFASLVKCGIIGFVGICTICILVAFVVTLFCLKEKVYNHE